MKKVALKDGLLNCIFLLFLNARNNSAIGMSITWTLDIKNEVYPIPPQINQY